MKDRLDQVIESARIIGVTVPIRTSEWDTEREALHLFRDDARPILHVGGEKHHFGEYISVETSLSVIVIEVQLSGVMPAILQMDRPDTWLIGFDTVACGVDWRRGTLTFTIEFDGAFLGFHTVAGDRVLIVHELGLVMGDALGHIIWEFDARDIVTGWSVGPTAVHLKYFEGGGAEVDVRSGLLSDSCTKWTPEVTEPHP